MGNFLGNCQKQTPKRIGESDLDDVENGVQQEFPRTNFDIYDNPEDIIIEVTTHTKWEYHEGRQLLSKFRQITSGEPNISRSVFENNLLPSLLQSLMKDLPTFQEQNPETYAKLARSMWKLFLEYGQNKKEGIDFVAFVKLLGFACKGTNEERAKVVFHVFDVDLDANWNDDEFRLFLENCNSSLLNLDNIANWDKDTVEEKKQETGEQEQEMNGDNENVNQDDGKELENENNGDVEMTTQPVDEDGAGSSPQPGTNDPPTTYDEDENAATEEPDIPNDDPSLMTPEPPTSGDMESSAPPQGDGDFEMVGSVSDPDEEFTVDDPWALIGQHLRKRKNNREKISEEVAISYLSRSLDLPKLLSSFYVLPSVTEERETIKRLMDEATMELGGKWFVVSAEWWNAWAKYVEYEEQVGMSSATESADDIGATNALFASHAERSMRPLGVSNADLLDDKSHHPVLKDELRENDDYLLVPGPVWKQFMGWYGGGPPISRQVICVQKEVRDRIWEIELPRVRTAHEQKEQAAKSKTAVQTSDDSNNEQMTQLLMELNMMANPQALRIDLRPVYAVCYSIDSKAHVDLHDMKPINITRYATLLEFYEYACAVVGIDPSKYEADVRPRLWQLVDHHGDLKHSALLYPRMQSSTKICLVHQKKVYPAFLEEPETKAPEEDEEPNEDSAAVRPEDGGGVSVLDGGGQNENEIDDEDRASDGGDEEATEEITEELDDLGSLNIRSGISVGIEIPNNKGQFALTDPNDDSWKHFQSGRKIDCRDSLGKWYEATIEKVKLIDFNAEPEAETPLEEGAAVTSPEASTAESSPKTAESSKGTPATGAKKKGPPNGKIDEPPTARKAAIFVHYKSWPRKWDEWILLDPDMICYCTTVCDKPDRHRIAKPATQSVWKSSKARFGQSTRYYGYGRGPRASMSGAPTIPGVVGLSNLGNTCFMNSILQCLSNTPHLQSFFLTGQYRQDINKTNVLGTGGKLASEFYGLLSEIWSGKYKVVAPRSMKRAIGHYAPQFEGYQQHDSQEFLSFLLDGLHEDLNLVKEKPYTEKIESDGRPDSVVSKLSWQIHLLRNQSKIVDLFQCQVKSKVYCPECNRVSVTFDPLMYLSLPIPGQMKKEILVDVVIQEQSLPIRHVFVANKYDRARVIATEIAEKYEWREDFILLYEVWSNKVQRELDKQTWISSIHTHGKDNKVVAYLLKDWNAEISPEQIKEKKIRLMLGYFNQSLGHSETAQSMTKSSSTTTSTASRYGGSGSRIRTTGFSTRSYTSYRETYYFGLPLVISYLNISTRKELHHLVRNRIRNLAPQLFEPRPVPQTAETTTENESEEPATDEAQDTAATEEPQNPEQPPADELEEAGPPSYDEVAATDAEEDSHFEENLPYRLICFDDYRKRTAYQKGQVHPSMVVAYDDEIFLETVSLSRNNQELQFAIEWKEHLLPEVHKALGSVLKSESYENFKQSTDPGRLTIFDCINNYCHEEVLSKGEEWYCSVCSKFQQATKKLDLWSFPEILIIHLKRFQMLSGRRGEKINLPIDYPLRGLDLSRYVIDDELATKPVYDLFAVSCHNGGLGGGHYTAYAKHPHEHRWFSFNDSNVRPAQESEIKTPSAYVLFYRKCH